MLSEHVGVSQAMAFLREVAEGGFLLEVFTQDDVSSVVEVLDRYSDLGIGLADASIVVLAARYSCRSILTLDERHFRAIRLWDGMPPRLLPADN